MSAVGNTVLTLADWAKRLDPDGKVPTIVELLAQTNEMLEDMVWKEGNLPIGEEVTLRTGLPTVYWRMINAATPPSKSQTAQITEKAGMLEAWSAVDAKLAKLNGNFAEFRASENTPFLEAMNQEMQGTLMYGNSGLSPAEFTGFAPRYSSLSAGNATNIINAAGTQDSPSDLTSIWLVAWGPQTVYGIFPKGSKAGIEHTDWGKQVIESGGLTGNVMSGYRDQWTWDAGLVVKDWRYVVRIANVDLSDVAAETTTASIFQHMKKALRKLPNRLGRPVFYMNRSTVSEVDRLAGLQVAGGGGLTYENFDGRQITKFQGVPIRIVDQILSTETAVS
jgi:hypothetical protein